MNINFFRSLLFAGLLVLSTIRLLASPQLSELLIIQNDTIPIYQIILSDDMTDKLYHNIEKIKNEIDTTQFLLPATNNWRGYRGIWMLENDSLFLVGLISNYGRPSLEHLFPDKTNKGKVLADWYNSKLIIPKGRVLRWDGIFERTYVEEEHLKFHNGRVTSRKTIHNYIDLPKGVNRLTQNTYSPQDVQDVIVAALFNHIVSRKTDWNALDEHYWQGIEDDYTITIGANGRVVSVKDGLDERTRVTRFLKRRLRKLQFDIIKFNGKPFKESIILELKLNENTNKLELW